MSEKKTYEELEERIQELENQLKSGGNREYKSRLFKNGDAARIGNAIDKVIDEMSEDFEIKKFITANRAEVKDMCLTEYNEAETMEMLKEEGWQEGLQKARVY